MTVCVCKPESQFCNEFVLEAAVQLHKNKVYFIIVLQMFNVCFLLLTLSLSPISLCAKMALRERVTQWTHNKA